MNERDGVVLVHCQSGCPQDLVITALRDQGVWGAESRADSNGRPSSRLVASRPVRIAGSPAATRTPPTTHVYRICDLGGETIALHRRLEYPDGSKAFSWQQPGGEPGLKGSPVASLPLYRTETLAELRVGAPVVVTEGEKAADSLAEVLGKGAGVVATVTGASACPSDDVLSTVAERRVVLWADADDPGRDHMRKVAERLQRIGAADVKVVDWTDAPGHGDAADFVAGRSRDELLALLKAAVPFVFQEASAEPETSQTAIAAAGPTWPAPLDAAAFFGLAGEFVRTVEPYTEADPAALLLSLLVEFSSAVGNTPHVMVGATRHPARLSAVVVGQTGKARKGDSEKPPSTVIRGADPAWGARVMQGLSTGEGVIATVRDKVERPDPKTGELIVIDEGVADKRLLALAPEFGRVLRVMGRDGNTLSAVIREAWDDGDLRVMTKTPTVATNAHVAVLGHVTLEELRRELQDTDAASGFANRFLWVVVKRARLLPDPPAFEGEVVEALSRKVAEALDFAQQTGAVRRDPEASELWAAIYGNLSRDRPGLAGAVLGRHEAQAVRLSLVYALLDQSPVIRVEHLMGAVAVLDYVAASANFIFGDALGDSVADRIRAALGDSELTRTAIYSDIFGRHVSQNRIESALRLLDDLGLAHVKHRLTGGRPVEVWRAGSGAAQKAQEAYKAPSDPGDIPLDALTAPNAQGQRASEESAEQQGSPALEVRA